MPSRPPHPCAKPGCSALVVGASYCPAHEDERRRDRNAPDRRGSRQDRGYDTRWEAERLAFLRGHPLCEDCQQRGMVVPAALVHHEVPIAERPDLRLDHGNLAALCRECHERRHGRKAGWG